MIKKIKNTVPWTYVSSDLKIEEMKKTNPKVFRVEKVVKKKGDKLYVKWKGYDSSFNN